MRLVRCIKRYNPVGYSRYHEDDDVTVEMEEHQVGKYVTWDDCLELVARLQVETARHLESLAEGASSPQAKEQGRHFAAMARQMPGLRLLFGVNEKNNLTRLVDRINQESPTQI